MYIREVPRVYIRVVHRVYIRGVYQGGIPGYIPPGYVPGVCTGLYTTLYTPWVHRIHRWSPYYTPGVLTWVCGDEALGSRGKKDLGMRRREPPRV